MKNYTCEKCNRKPADHFNETVRNQTGGGSIMNLCHGCWWRIPPLNKRVKKEPIQEKDIIRNEDGDEVEQ